MMPKTDHGNVVSRFYEVGVNERSWDAVDTLLASNFTHNGQVRGPAGQRQALEALYAAFPDIRVVLDQTIVAGDDVVSRMTWRGTQRGPFLGIAPTGKHVSFSAISIIRVVDGKIAQAWVNEDDLGVLQQLGGRIGAP
jgi:steroid delta-isomerase-like uncharacterized protein